MNEARWTIAIDKDVISRAEVTPNPARSIAEGKVEFRLDCCAMTANNVTYAALGKPSGLFENGKGYWDFFAPGDGPGTLPVWGFATVTQSNVEGIGSGEQFYGFFPFASHCVLQPVRVGPLGFVDDAPHKRDMAAVYLTYQRVSGLDGYRLQDHDYWPVFRPLYMTGWLIADQFEDEEDYGAQQIVVASASAKTAIAFAHASRARPRRPLLVGLTSGRGKTFLDQTELYDALVTYDEIESLNVAATAVIDIAGSTQVMGKLHDRLGDQLRHSLVVGKSHWDAGTGEPWPASGFFAPGRIQKRMQQWGPAEFRDRVGAAWSGFVRDAERYFTLDRRQGPEMAIAAYQQAVAGTLDPRAAVLLTP